jgi:hypothetical protein
VEAVILGGMILLTLLIKVVAALVVVAVVEVVVRHVINASHVNVESVWRRLKPAP